jgi:hypothetical protein
MNSNFNKFRFIGLLSLTIFFFNCEKTINDYHPQQKNLQVINSIQHPDSVINCQISAMAMLDGKPYVIENALVTLVSQNNLTLDTLTYTSNGQYKSDSKFTTANEKFTLKSIAPGFPNASCVISLPQVPLFKIDTLLYNFFFQDPFNYSFDNRPKYLSGITIYDDSQENFYQLEIYDIDSSLNNNTGFYEYKYNFITYTDSDNLVVKNEGEQHAVSFSRGIYFNDETFNGTNFNLDFHTGVSSTSSVSYGTNNTRLLAIVLKNISNHYYEYLKSSNKQFLAIDNINNNSNYVFDLYPMSPAHSNVTGGYGIIATYNYCMKKLIVTRN